MTRATLPEMARETVKRTVTVMGWAKAKAMVVSGPRAFPPGPLPAAQAVAEAPRA